MSERALLIENPNQDGGADSESTATGGESE